MNETISNIAKIAQAIHDLVMTILKIFKVDGNLPNYDFDKEEIGDLETSVQTLAGAISSLTGGSTEEAEN